MSEQEIAHNQIKVFGRVQGVFFRDSTQKQAQQLGLKGFVRNQPDGSVYIEAEGNPDQLQQLVEWVKEGPSQADVDKVTVTEGEVQSYPNFRVKT